jgi:transcriptional regulator with XRE-family HTH domain
VLGQKVREARIGAGLTQEQLAAKAGISREYVNYIERNKRQPTVAIFIKLCKAMKIHPPELLERIIRS